MASQSPDGVLARLNALQQSQELSILKIAEPISGGQDATGGNNNPRASDVSADAFDNPTSASLEADLTHYKELFSKLRFSYLEQVTKEKFLRSIVGDPPLIVEAAENVELERQLAEVKASLKAQKVQVAALVQELEERGRELVRRHEDIKEQKAILESLPAEIQNLQTSIIALTPSSPRPPTHAETLAHLEARKAELAVLNHQLSTTQSTLPRVTRKLDALEAELRPLESQKLGSLSAAKEARRRKDDRQSGVGDDLEERGRWWRGVEGGLKGVLGV